MLVTKSNLLFWAFLAAFNFSFYHHGAEGRECGTHDLTEEERDEAESRLDEYIGGIGGLEMLPRQQRIIDTYWHVLHDGNTGRLSQGDIEASMRVLNEDFANSGSTFRFNLVGTTYSNNRRWFNGNEIRAMSRELREGDCSTANIYSADMGNILGFVNYFPSEVSDSCSGDYINDGIWIRYDTIPGGSADRYNEGKTLVHEVGHWMGLYHTFEGCSGPGDRVDDTPPERSPNYGCPSSRNTCPGGGPDPIHNYMDYSDDDCVTEFTPGQIDRMLAQFNAFRANGEGNPDPELISGRALCYSPNAMVTSKEHQGKKIAMKDLTVGDSVLTASGQYQTVYTINHYHTTKPTNFLQIHTEMVQGNNTENALEISPMHLVFMDGKEHPIPAMDIKVGDYLQTLEYGPQKVIDIQVIRRNGLYNPITTDGTMVVDGIVTSSYTSFTGSAHLEIAGTKLMSVHELLDLTIAPYRAFCMSTFMCDRHAEGELPLVVQLISRFYDFWSAQTVTIKVVIISIYLLIFFALNFLLSKYGMLMLATVGAGWVFTTRRSNLLQTNKNAVLSQKKSN